MKMEHLGEVLFETTSSKKTSDKLMNIFKESKDSYEIKANFLEHAEMLADKEMINIIRKNPDIISK